MAAVSSTDSVVCVTNASFAGSRTSSFARLLDVLDEVHAAAAAGVEAAHGAFDFGMAGVADEHHVAPFARVSRHFHVHLGHQRTGGVEHREPAARGFVLDGGGNAMRGEDDRGAVRHLVELVDEHRAELAQALDHVHVVHHLVAHVDRRAEQPMARSTMSIARSTPAQKPRGLASRIFHAACAACARAPSSDRVEDHQHGADTDGGIGDVERREIRGTPMRVHEVDHVAVLEAGR